MGLAMLVGGADALLAAFWVLLGTLCAIVLSVVSKVLSDDAKTFVPRLCKKLLKSAAEKIPVPERQRYLEEWLAALDEHEELSGKLYHACAMYFIGSRRLVHELGIGIPSKASRAINSAAISVFWMLFFPIGVVFFGTVAVLLARSGVSPVKIRRERCDHCGARHLIMRLNTLVNNPKKALADYFLNEEGEYLRWLMGKQLKHDPRLSPVGSFLVRTRMDIVPVPQLILHHLVNT